MISCFSELFHFFKGGLARRDGPFINSSVGGAAFMPIVGAICFGLKTLSSVFCEKLPSRRQRSFNILAMRKGKYEYAFSSLTVSAWNFCVRLEYFLWPRSLPAAVSCFPLERCILWSMAANIIRMMK